jgi:hypothetical protein
MDDQMLLQEQFEQLTAEYELVVRATLQASAWMPSPATEESLTAWKVALEWEHRTAVRLRQVREKLSSLVDQR